MEAKELRIGNYVNENYGGIYEVININSEGFDYLDLRKPTFKAIGRFDMSSITPIPLTEEILLKCGFERSDNDLFELKVNGNIDIWFRTEKTLYANIDVYDENIKDTSSASFSHIKTLHQLQNLYFTLTNKELEINL